jgi:CheY-like chemotaxis protein
MSKSANAPSDSVRTSRALGLARVLLVHGDLASRLALQTILEAGGYTVDVAARPAEALSMLDEGEYELVLSDEEFGSRDGGRNVLAYARVKAYRPATALVTSDESTLRRHTARGKHQVSVYTENLPTLLGKVAELIGIRAIRRYRPLRHAV